MSKANITIEQIRSIDEPLKNGVHGWFIGVTLNGEITWGEYLVNYYLHSDGSIHTTTINQETLEKTGYFKSKLEAELAKKVYDNLLAAVAAEKEAAEDYKKQANRVVEAYAIFHRVFKK